MHVAIYQYGSTPINNAQGRKLTQALIAAARELHRPDSEFAVHEEELDQPASLPLAVIALHPGDKNPDFAELLNSPWQAGFAIDLESLPGGSKHESGKEAA